MSLIGHKADMAVRPGRRPLSREEQKHLLGGSVSAFDPEGTPGRYEDRYFATQTRSKFRATGPYCGKRRSLARSREVVVWKRREFIALLGGGLVAWPRGARSQKPAVPRVGYIWIGARGTDVSNAGLRQGLIDLGYVLGRNLILEEGYANGNPERVPGLIAELLALNVDIFVTPGTPLTLAAQRATSTLPIVCVTGDPVRAGLAASLARPGATSLACLQRKVVGNAEGGSIESAARGHAVEFR
jgi:hypothetical protein